MAVGVVGGMLWMLANLWMLHRLTTPMVTNTHLGFWRLTGLWLLKVPVLYTLAGVLLLARWSSPIGFLGGLVAWFALLWANALRRAWA